MRRGRSVFRGVLLLLAVLPLPAAAQMASLSIGKAEDVDPVAAGASLTYTVTVSNEGPDDAAGAELSDPLPAGTTFQSLSAPGGWTCTAPAVGASGTVSCAMDPFAPGSAVFTLVVQVDAGLAAGTVLTNTATVSSTTADPEPGNESATVDTTVGAAPGQVSVAVGDAPDPAVAGFDDVAYTIAVASSLPDGTSPVLTAPVPAGTAFQSFAAPGGWSCSTPPVGSGGTVSCSAATLAAGDSTFILTVHVLAAAVSPVTATASLAVETGGRTATVADSESTAVLAPTVLSATKTAAGQLVPGGALVYTIVLTNQGPGDQADDPGDELADVLPPQLVLASASATTGTAVATPATRTVTWNGALAAGGSATITIQATIAAGTPFGSVVANQAALAFDADGDGANESAGVSDDPALPGGGDPTAVTLAAVVEVPALDVLGFALLAALLAVAGARRLRAR